MWLFLIAVDGQWEAVVTKPGYKLMEMVLSKISRHHGWNERLKKLQNEIFKYDGEEFLGAVGSKTSFWRGRGPRAGRRENGK